MVFICAAFLSINFAEAYEKRPKPEQVFNDYNEALDVKLKKYDNDEEVIADGLEAQATYFENKNGKKKSLIVIQSGIHGIETYAGSMLQQIFLKEFFDKYYKSGHSILLIHSLNSWGFLNHRRFTESGVDLNRNHDTSRELFKNPNDKYKHIRKYLLRTGPVNSPRKDLLSLSFEFLWANIVERITNDFTTDDFREALGNGQYQFPKEIGFGGYNFEPQVKWAQKRLPQIFRRFNRILVLDFHTGLGEKGKLHLILSGRESDVEKDRITKLFSKGIENKSYEINTGDSEGFYYTNGDYLTFVRKLNPDARIVALTAEFGTMGLSLPNQIQTIARLVLENQGHWQGYGSDEAKAKTQSYLLDLFAPDEKSWWESVEQKGRALFDESLTALDQKW